MELLAPRTYNFIYSENVELLAARTYNFTLI